MAYVRLLLAFIFPPAAVYLQFGVGKQFWINVVLTLLGFMPGMVHAVYVMIARPPGLIRRERFDRPEDFRPSDEVQPPSPGSTTRDRASTST